MPLPCTSFSIECINKTTFLIQEHDKYNEHPYIYAKLHPSAPVIILNDTGCNAPAKEWEKSDIIHLKDLLEEYKVKDNDNRPLNPKGRLPYVLILSHCHYDHICGIEQFLNLSQKTEIIASATGRDFVESDLGAHSLCNHMNIRIPAYKVTHWAQNHEKLTWPLARRLPGDDASNTQYRSVDLGITILHTPGHTPDALSWFDHAEGNLYVGDSFYRMGADSMPIYFPPQGNLIDWIYSMRFVHEFVTKQDNTLEEKDVDLEDDWIQVEYTPKTKLSASHQTGAVPAMDCIKQATQLVKEVVQRKRKPLSSQIRYKEDFDYYMSDLKHGDAKAGMSLLLPRRLVDDAAAYFSDTAQLDDFFRTPQKGKLFELGLDVPGLQFHLGITR